MCIYRTGERNDHKKKLHTHVKLQHKKLVRDRGPIEYITQLPETPDDMLRGYPRQFSAAYPKRQWLANAGSPRNRASSHILGCYFPLPRQG